MSKIRVNTSYNERTNTYGYINFTISENDVAIGSFYNHEEIKDIIEIEPDIESMHIKSKYKLVKIITTYNQEYDPNESCYCEEYLAIEL